MIHLHACTAEATAIGRAASPDYRRWLDHVSSVGGCERPIWLVGHLHTIDPASGEVLSSRSTKTLPDGVIFLPCGDRHERTRKVVDQRLRSLHGP